MPTTRLPVSLPGPLYDALMKWALERDISQDEAVVQIVALGLGVDLVKKKARKRKEGKVEDRDIADILAELDAPPRRRGGRRPG